MKVFKWHPAEDSGFTGKVEVEIPNYKERISIMQEMGIKDEASVGLETGSKVIELVEKQVKSVDLSYGDEVFKDLDSLGYSREGMDVINQLGNVIMGGIPLGNA